MYPAIIYNNGMPLVYRCAYMFDDSSFLSVRYTEVEFTGVWNAECATDCFDSFMH